MRTFGELAERFTERGAIVIVSAISPYRAARDEVRRRIGNFLEVGFIRHWNFANGATSRAYTAGPHRRVAARYRNRRPYERPLAPDVECRTDRETLGESVAKVLEAAESWIAKR